MVNQNKMRIIFSQKADLALSEIIKKYNLDQYAAAVKIDFISKSFTIEKISEKDMPNFVQKELGVSSQIAQEISKEILTTIIPFLEKIPEEKFNDSKFVEEISKKVFGESIKNTIETGKDILPKIKAPIIFTDIMEKNPTTSEEPINTAVAPPKKQRIKKPIISEEIDESAPQPKPQPRQQRGPDSYREPIE